MRNDVINDSWVVLYVYQGSETRVRDRLLRVLKDEPCLPFIPTKARPFVKGGAVVDV